MMMIDRIKSCYQCPWFMKDHWEMYGETLCELMDSTIRLRRGQHRPDDCPFRDESWQRVKGDR